VPLVVARQLRCAHSGCEAADVSQRWLKAALGSYKVDKMCPGLIHNNILLQCFQTELWARQTIDFFKNHRGTVNLTVIRHIIGCRFVSSHSSQALRQ
jgi:hypothetical protein